MGCSVLFTLFYQYSVLEAKLQVVGLCRERVRAAEGAGDKKAAAFPNGKTAAVRSSGSIVMMQALAEFFVLLVQFFFQQGIDAADVLLQ